MCREHTEKGLALGVSRYCPFQLVTKAVTHLSEPVSVP